MSDPQQQRHEETKEIPQPSFRIKGRRRTKKLAWETSRKNSSPGKTRLNYLLPAGIIAIGFVGILWFLTQKRNQTTPPPYQAPAPPKSTSEKLLSDWEENYHQSLDNKPLSPAQSAQYRKAAQNFTQERDPNRRLQWARFPQRIKELMLSFPDQALFDIPASLEAIPYLSPKELSESMHFVATFDNGDHRLVAVINTKNGPKVDWETYARHTSVTWPHILSAKMNEATVRVFITQSDYYNFDFKDETTWVSYELNSPDFDRPLFAYCRKSNEIAQKLLTVPENQRVTLRIKLGQSTSEHQQCEICEVLTMGWTLAEETH